MPLLSSLQAKGSLTELWLETRSDPVAESSLARQCLYMCQTVTGAPAVTYVLKSHRTSVIRFIGIENSRSLMGKAKGERTHSGMATVQGQLAMELTTSAHGEKGRRCSDGIWSLAS